MSPQTWTKIAIIAMITKYSVRQQIKIHLRKSVWSSGRSSENFILWTVLKRITSSSLVFSELVFIVTVSWMTDLMERRPNSKWGCPALLCRR